MADDANGQARGLRAIPTAKLVTALGVHYGLDASAAADLGGGLNLNLLVMKGSARYVARVYRPYVTPERLDDIQRVRRELARAGVPCSPPVPTGDGKPWIRVEGRMVEVESYVEHDHSRMITPDLLQRGLPMLGRIHSLLREVEVSPAGRLTRYANHIEPDEVYRGTAAGTARIRSWDTTPAERLLADRSDRLAALVWEAESGLVGRLPRQLVHGDFWDDNVFFRGARLVHVGDFDFMGEHARIDDLALTLHFADVEFGHLDNGRRIDALRRLVDAYGSGLDQRLSDVERTALPWALARQPLWSIGGWVPRLDDQDHARRHAAASMDEVERALWIAQDADRWVAAFTR
ncbi:phosphotransferase [Actinopolymorpha alba]|uniref:phosphotransferase n=1 Tax=Actinopolymorpha alba TaxID=533267 RepID=UPI00036B0E2E|nr:phosphotransferase [Actinopolymorpha alba]